MMRGRRRLPPVDPHRASCSYGINGSYRTNFFPSLDAIIESSRIGAPAHSGVLSSGARWFGFPDGVIPQGEDMFALPYRPDPIALQTIEEMRKSLSADIPAPVDRRRRPTWSPDTGDEVCIDRLRSGQDPWRRVSRVNTSGPAHLTLGVHIGGSSSIPARDLLWGPAAALALTDLLENAGYRVRMLLVNCGENAFHADPKSVLNVIQVKGFQDPLNLQALSATATPWFFRYHVLASYCAIGKPSYGYGASSPSSEYHVRKVLEEGEESRIHLIPCGAYTQEKAAQNVKSAMESMFQKKEV